jgi:hypothetical protein
MELAVVRVGHGHRLDGDGLLTDVANRFDRTPLIGPPATRAWVDWSASTGPRTRRA